METIEWLPHQTARAIYLKECLKADGIKATAVSLLDLDRLLPGTCLQVFVDKKNKVADKLFNIERSEAAKARRLGKSEALLNLAKKN